MQHVDPDRLTLLALNEPGVVDDVEVTAHLERCVLCRTEVETLRRTVELAREAVDYRDEEPRAPEAVWARISADLGFADPSSPASDKGAGRPGHLAEDRDRHAAGGRPGDDRGPAAHPTGDSSVRGGDVHGADVHGADVIGSDSSRVAGTEGWDPGDSDRVGDRVVAMGSRRRPRWTRTVATLAAAMAVGVTGTLVAVRPWDDGAGVPAVASSAASLEPVSGGPAGVSGRAVVREGEAGPELDISAAGLPSQPGYYEVWVFDGDRNMVSVGVLGPDSTAALPLPPTLDLRTYHVVDISEEQYDGDQTHSQTSVLRGTLTS